MNFLINRLEKRQKILFKKNNKAAKILEEYIIMRLNKSAKRNVRSNE